jgi:hypothetical protein
MISWMARRKTSTVVTLTTGEVWVMHSDGRRFRCGLDGTWTREADDLGLTLADGTRLACSMGKLVLSTNAALG